MERLRDIIPILKAEGKLNSGYSTYHLSSITKINGGYKCVIKAHGLSYSHHQPTKTEDDAIYAVLAHINSMGSLTNYKTDFECTNDTQEIHLSKKRKTKSEVNELSAADESVINVESEDDGDIPKSFIENPVERERSIIVELISK